MDIEKMTEALQAIILAAMTKAQECNHVEIAPEHVLLAMLDDNGLDGIWSRLNCDKQKMIAFVEGYLNRLAVVPDSDRIPFCIYSAPGEPFKPYPWIWLCQRHYSTAKGVRQDAEPLASVGFLVYNHG